VKMPTSEPDPPTPEPVLPAAPNVEVINDSKPRELKDVSWPQVVMSTVEIVF